MLSTTSYLSVAEPLHRGGAINVAAVPKISTLARIINNDRSKTRPKHPKTLDFSLNVEHFPADFFRADIRVGKSRHFIFAILIICNCNFNTHYRHYQL